MIFIFFLVFVCHFSHSWVVFVESQSIDLCCWGQYQQSALRCFDQRIIRKLRHLSSCSHFSKFFFWCGKIEVSILDIHCLFCWFVSWCPLLDVFFSINYICRSCGVDVRVFKDPKVVDPKEIESALSQIEKLVLLVPEIDQCTVSHVRSQYCWIRLFQFSSFFSFLFRPFFPLFHNKIAHKTLFDFKRCISFRTFELWLLCIDKKESLWLFTHFHSK